VTIERNLTEMARLFDRMCQLAKRFEEKRWRIVHAGAF